ncbi:hypothetical protein G0Q06_11965 [Puniceicoccales bacterium CK1056]|uniref:DUF432 domain-containing protein n=1 Tax=Oceanipulchritudo coccoides TaxID=2706888 RepID=A0A6B2M2C9_9BACT|nr:DUF432 domain-containing protein [Oceanipulchritudo coccoides]NDV63171.1 hypothetical protein [Oceanipulchritudo coccoides]
MRDLRQFWSARRIGENRVSLARLGPLKLWVSRNDQEWAYACEYGDLSDVQDIAQVPFDVIPEGMEWTKTVFASAPREVRFQPTVPDRPLVVKPEHPVVIPVGELGLFFVLMPVFISIRVEDKGKEIELGIVPSRQLSDTWFGHPTVGEFCYSLPFAAERDFSVLNPYPHHVVCPIQIKNRSDESLVFEKLCFRPNYVSLYCGNRHLWSSKVGIKHDGNFKGTNIRYEGLQPEMEDDALKVASAVKQTDKGLHRLTFHSGFKNDFIIGR